MWTHLLVLQVGYITSVNCIKSISNFNHTQMYFMFAKLSSFSLLDKEWESVKSVWLPTFPFLLSFLLSNVKKSSFPYPHIFWYKTWSLSLDFFLWVLHPYFHSSKKPVTQFNFLVTINLQGNLNSIRFELDTTLQKYI